MQRTTYQCSTCKFAVTKYAPVQLVPCIYCKEPMLCIAETFMADKQLWSQGRIQFEKPYPWSNRYAQGQ